MHVETCLNVCQQNNFSNIVYFREFVLLHKTQKMTDSMLLDQFWKLMSENEAQQNEACLKILSHLEHKVMIKSSFIATTSYLILKSYGPPQSYFLIFSVNSSRKVTIMQK